MADIQGTKSQDSESYLAPTGGGLPYVWELPLTYADQRGSHGTAHWWRLYYGDFLKSQVETILQGTALVAKKQTPTSTNQANSGVRAPYEWGGMYFRSKVEIKVAQELERRGLTFFANIRGRYSLDGSPVSKKIFNGRVELDFLVFHKGNCAILQVDGTGHRDNQDWDYGVDREWGFWRRWGVNAKITRRH